MNVVTMGRNKETKNEGAKSMKTLKFGVELETIAIERWEVAAAIRAVVGGEITHVGEPSQFDPWTVKDARGRIWKVVADGSLSADRAHQAEIVSPILEYADLEELQEVVRAVRRAGASSS
jgi:hypothetical protein